MTALGSLKQEHALIGRALTALGRYATLLEASPSADHRDLQRFSGFFSDFTDLWHHGKEEDLLLPALVKNGFAWDEGPVARVREDHEQTTYLCRVIQQAAAQEGAWTDEDRRHAIVAIRSFIDFERLHMEREETVLYQAAINRLPGETIEEIGRRCLDFEHQQFGAGAYDRLRADAEALFRKYEEGPR